MRDIKCSPEAREKCPFSHPCLNEDMAWFEEDSPCDKFNKSLIPSPPPTNADHIRAMSDKELAKFLNDFFWGAKKEVRLFALKEWLKQPYKGEKENGTN